MSAGKQWILLDREPAPCAAFVIRDGVLEPVTTETEAAGEDRYTAHFDTCPFAPMHRG